MVNSDTEWQVCSIFCQMMRSMGRGPDNIQRVTVKLRLGRWRCTNLIVSKHRKSSFHSLLVIHQIHLQILLPLETTIAKRLCCKRHSSPLSGVRLLSMNPNFSSADKKYSQLATL